MYLKGLEKEDLCIYELKKNGILYFKAKNLQL